MTESSLKVPSLACDACARSIKQALSRLSGMGSIEIDVKNKTIKLNYDDSKISLVDIKKKLDDIGYSAS